MKILNRFRKLLLRFVLSFPSKSGVSPTTSEGFMSRRQSCDRPEPPKTSCSSSYYSPNSHYSEAIADCIEFFNKSSHEEPLDDRKLNDVWKELLLILREHILVRRTQKKRVHILIIVLVSLFNLYMETSYCKTVSHDNM